MCKRCKTSYSPRMEEKSSEVAAVKDGNVDPTSSSGEGFAAQSAFPLLPSMTIPATLRKLREDLGLSQRHLAERIGVGVPRTYVSKIENGKATPTIESIKRFAQALQVSVADLVQGTHHTERDPFVLEVFEGTRKLPQRQRDYIVDMVRQLATTERRATA